METSNMNDSGLNTPSPKNKGTKKKKGDLIKDILSQIKTEWKSDDGKKSAKNSSAKSNIDTNSLIQSIVKSEASDISKHTKRKSLNKSVSVPVPLLKKIKTEPEDVDLPKPIKTEKDAKNGDNNDVNKPGSTNIFENGVNGDASMEKTSLNTSTLQDNAKFKRKNSLSSTTSLESTSLNHANHLENTVKVKKSKKDKQHTELSATSKDVTPKKKESKNKSSLKNKDDSLVESESSSLQENETPIKEKKQKNKLRASFSAMAVATSTPYKTKHSSENSSDSEVPVPLPKAIKTEADWLNPRKENSETNAQIKGDSFIGNKSVNSSVPLPIKKKSDKSKTTSLEESGEEPNNKDSGLADKLPLPIQSKKEFESDDSMERLDQNDILTTTSKSVSVGDELKVNWKQKIKRKNPNLDEIMFDTSLPVDADTQFYLLKLPKCIDPDSLLKKKIKLHSKSTVDLNNKEYVFNPLLQEPCTALIHSNTPKVVQIQGKLTLQKASAQTKVIEVRKGAEDNAPFCEEQKIRHPLFGVCYKDKIKMDKVIVEKIRDAIEHKTKQEMKKRKKKKGVKREIDDSVDYSKVFEFQ